MIYAQYINEQIVNYPASLEYLVKQGVLTTDTPTEEQRAEADVITIAPIASNPPVDGHQYATQPVLQPDQTWQEEWVAITTELQRVEGEKVYAQHMTVERNMRLGYTDWIVTKCAEAGEPVPQEWRTYRQALRDVPAQTGWPFDITWPTRPA